MSSVIDDLKSRLKTDETFQDFRNIVTAAHNRLDYDNLYDELMRLHSTRAMRTLYLTKIPPPDRVMDAVLMDAAYRSRVVEITIDITKNLRTLESAVDNIIGYVSVEYAENVLFPIKSRVERQEIVKSLISKVQTVITKYQSLVEFTSFVMNDIDKSSFACKGTIELLVLINAQRTVGGISLERG